MPMRCEELSAGKLLEEVSLLLREKDKRRKERKKSHKEKQIQRTALRSSSYILRPH